MSQTEETKEPFWFKLTFGVNGMHVRRSDWLPSKAMTSDAGDCFVLWKRHIEGFPDTLCCDVIKCRNLRSGIASMLRAILLRKLPLETPPQIILPYKLSEEAYIDINGNLPVGWLANFHLYPNSFQEFSKNVYQELDEELRSFIKTLRWSQGATGGQSPFSICGFSFSTDKTQWHSLPGNGTAVALETKAIDNSAEAFSAAQKLWSEGKREPLGHELIREAFDICWSHQRSALLIAVSALETGLKNYIEFLVPHSDILLEKMQSPPILVLAQETIPAIHKRMGQDSSYFPLSKSAKEYLQKWINQRNDVAHGRKEFIDSAKLSEFLRFVRSTLYSIDILKGEIWARSLATGTNSII